MLVICFTVFAATVPVSIILPMLPYIGQEYGAGPFEVSLLFAVMPAITIFVAPFWGRLSDRIGRKRVYVTTLAASSVAFAMFGFADSLNGMFLARFLQGLANGSVAVSYAMTADASNPGTRARDIGFVSGAMAMGFFLGPVLGGFFMSSEPFNHSPPAYFASGLCALSTVIAVVNLKETRGAHARVTHVEDIAGSATPAPAPEPLVSRATLILLILLFLIAGFTSATTQFAYTFWAQGALHWAPSDVSFGMGAIGAAYLIATVGLVGPLSKRFGDERTLIIGATVDVIGMALFLIAHSDAVSGIGGILVSITGGGMWNTVLSSIISKASPPHQTGMMLGLSNGANMVGRVIGPLTGGLLLATGLTVPFAANLTLTVVVVIAGLRIATLARLARAWDPRPS